MEYDFEDNFFPTKNTAQVTNRQFLSVWQIPRIYLTETPAEVIMTQRFFFSLYPPTHVFFYEQLPNIIND